MYDYRPAEIPPLLTRLMAAMHGDDAERIGLVFQFAAAAHDQHHRDEGTPFIEHPVAVLSILWDELGCRNIEVLIAALSHDVLEDCEWLSEDDLSGMIGPAATELVREVTKEQVADHDKAGRDLRYMEHLWRITPDAKLLKLADRIHNLRSIPNANDPAKARRYLEVSRREFYPLALSVDPTAARLIAEACDAIETYLSDRDGP
ncbi:MAG: HD domain-containing protein [Vicinamibacterales bacterium]